MAYIFGGFDVLLFPHYYNFPACSTSIHKHTWFSKILVLKSIVYYVHVQLDKIFKFYKICILNQTILSSFHSESKPYQDYSWSDIKLK